MSLLIMAGSSQLMAIGMVTSGASLFTIILGMTLVTYLPRMIPSVVMDKIFISPKIEKFLRMIPYTAMAALIFPGVLTVDSAHPEIGLAGGAVADFPTGGYI